MVFPSYVKVLYDNAFQKKEMKEFLTIAVPGAKYTKMYKNKVWDGRKCFYDRFKEGFPIGFLYRVINKFGIKQDDIDDTRKYKHIPFAMPKLEGIELRMYQREAIYAGWEYKNCLVQAATNAGKSAIMAGLIKILREEKVLVLVHRMEIFWQLREMLEDLTEMDVGIVKADEYEPDQYVNIAMVLTMLNRLDDHKAITEMFNASRVIMIDECHHLQSTSFQNLLRRSPAVYRYGFSGTVQEESTYEGWLTRQYIGDVVFNISNKELIEQGISAEPRIILFRITHHVDYPRMIQEIKADLIAKGKLNPEDPEYVQRQQIYKPLYGKIFKRYLIENPERNAIIVREICETFKDRQVLIVVDSLEHGEILKEMIRLREPTNVEFIHGSSEFRVGSLFRFKEGNLRVLISSNIIDEGVDISRIQVLFLAGGRKSRRQILQRIGRGLRRKEGENVVNILDFYDSDGKYLEKHSKERIKIYKKEGFEIDVV
jgi:superfamily II DNA or RNA helicase